MAATAKRAASKSKSVLTVPMTLDRETKNTRRYASDDEDAAITTLYIAKGASTPDEIVVTVSAG